MDKREPETVSALTRRIKTTLESSFPEVWVEGELSNFRIMSSGHAYFVLKDAAAQISCAFFSMARRMPPFEVKDGVKVRIAGELSLYEQRGTYQVVVRAMERAGLGDLMAQFEALKRRLDAEGLFAQDRKRPLPMLPRRIGIVTSPTGAAIRDMLNVTRRRFADLHILIAPARVQGAEAAPEIVAALELLNALPDPPDVIIVGRGGGSIEDLWCFNDEAVARAIHASRVPVISAVGHESDFTIGELRRDLRAPTPSAAAELVVACKADFEAAVATARDRLRGAMRRQLERARSRLDFGGGQPRLPPAGVARAPARAAARPAVPANGGAADGGRDGGAAASGLRHAAHGARDADGRERREARSREPGRRDEACREVGFLGGGAPAGHVERAARIGQSDGGALPRLRTGAAGVGGRRHPRRAGRAWRRARDADAGRRDRVGGRGRRAPQAISEIRDLLQPAVTSVN